MCLNKDLFKIMKHSMYGDLNVLTLNNRFNQFKRTSYFFHSNSFKAADFWTYFGFF